MGKRLTIGLALAAVASLPALYVASYLLLVQAKPLSFMSGEGPWPREAHYRAGGELAEWFFAPIQSVDEKLRRRYWEFHDEDSDYP